MYRYVTTGFIAVMVTFALLVFLNSAHSQSESAPLAGPYMIASGDRNMVWRIDQATGRVSYCQINSPSSDPKYVATQAPYCSAWSGN